MKLNSLKYILFGKAKPFQMTRNEITYDKHEFNALSRIAEVMETSPNKAIYELNQAPFLKEFVDYIQAFHEYGKGNRNDLYSKQLLPSAQSYIYKKLDLNVGIVADQFLFDALDGACHLTYLNGHTHETTFDFVIVASTWRGIDGYWEGVTNPHRQKFEELQTLVASFQSKGVPVVFFNKEDPVNFEVFLPHAKLADIVVTTEADLIPTYRKILKHSRIHHLQFPIHLGIHRPLFTKEVQKNEEVVFAGSWLEKYKERNEDAKQIFDGVLESAHKLTLFDRNLWSNQLKYQFPSEYIPYISAPLTHENTMKMHINHPFAINLNTIKYSRTMCANRIFELQGMGNFILSNYNTFINSEMPQVQMIFDKKDVATSLNLDSVIIQRARKIGAQQVLKQYNHFEWLKCMARWCDMNISATVWPKVSVIINDNDEAAVTMFEQQSYAHKVMVRGVEEVQTPFYTYFDSINNYQPEYLQDLVSTLTYMNTSFVTKMACANQFVTYYQDNAHTLFKKGVDKYVEGYACDKTFLNESPQEPLYETPQLSIIIPVYNNGAHLEHKALRSIIRNPQFSEFEIILVDDGSTDALTRRTIQLYEKWYRHFKVIRLEAPSGSASTPRNIGIQHANAPYLTFLDPDNEWVGDGINQLLQTIKADDGLDVVVGNMIKVDNEKTHMHQYYRQFINAMHQDETTDTKNVLHQMKLKTASIQALIARTSFVKQHKIQMVPGALGQDSLFFLNLIHFARKMKAIDATIHVYYAAIAQSMTNTISPSFFEKYLKLEKEKITFLKKHDYLQTYMKYRFNFYMKHWYIARIKRAEKLDKAVIESFLEIYHLYDNIKRPKDEDLTSEIKKLQSEVE